MKLLLAAYDPSHQTADGYWAWHHPCLSRTELEEFYYDHVASFDDDRDGKLGASACHGGCASLGDRCCVYRFLKGGFDRSGRPTWVLICGFISRAELRGHDWLGLLRSDEFGELARKNEPRGPLIAPPSLELTWTPASAEADLNIIRRAQRVALEERTKAGIQELGAAAANLSSEWQFQCQVREDEHGFWARLQSKPLHPPPPPPPPPPDPGWLSTILAILAYVARVQVPVWLFVVVQVFTVLWIGFLHHDLQRLRSDIDNEKKQERRKPEPVHREWRGRQDEPDAKHEGIESKEVKKKIPER